MTYCTYSILLQIVMQTISILLALNNDWEKVICILLVWQEVRKGDERIVDVLIVVVSHSLTMCVILNEILQLHVKNGCLNLIKTAVATRILEDVLLLAAIVSKGTNGSCKLRIVGSYSTTITKSSKVLTWVE